MYTYEKRIHAFGLSSKIRKILNPPILLTTFAATFWLFVFRNFTVDDAFIAWSHGKNLVEHGVYAFNTTGRRVEGATSPLIGLLSSLPILLQIDVVLFFKLLSICAVGGFVSAIYFLTQNIYRTSIIVLLTLAGPMQAIHVWSGLETFFLVSSLTVLFAIALLRPLYPVWLVSGLACVCIALRVEVVFSVLIALYLFDRGVLPARKREVLMRYVALSTAPLSCFLLIGAFRYAYFDQFVSQSSAAKTPISSFLNLNHLYEMLKYSFGNFLGHPFELVIAFFISLLIFASKSSHKKAFGALFVGQLAIWFVYFNSQLEMNFANRFSYQTFWPLVLAGIICFPSSRLSIHLYSMIIWGLTMVQIPTNEVKEILTYYPRLTTSHGVVGMTIKQCAGADQWIVGNDAGLVSYLTDNYYFDVNFLGTSPIDGFDPAIERISSGLAIVVGGSEPFVGLSMKSGSSANTRFLFARGVPETYSLGDYVVGVRFFTAGNPLLGKGLKESESNIQVSSFSEDQQIIKSIFGNYWRLPQNLKLSCSN